MITDYFSHLSRIQIPAAPHDAISFRIYGAGGMPLRQPLSKHFLKSDAASARSRQSGAILRRRVARHQDDRRRSTAAKLHARLLICRRQNLTFDARPTADVLQGDATETMMSRVTRHFARPHYRSSSRAVIITMTPLLESTSSAPKQHEPHIAITTAACRRCRRADFSYIISELNSFMK